MARDHASDEWQEAEAVEVVEGTEQRVRGPRELEHEQDAARRQHPAGLRQPALEVFQVADPERDHDGVHGAVAERQVEAVTADGEDVPRPTPPELTAAAAQHGEGEVQAEDLSIEPAFVTERACEIERSRAEIEHSRAPGGARSAPGRRSRRGSAAAAVPPDADLWGRKLIDQRPNGCASPQHVESAGEEPVQEVVPGRDRSEHAPDRRGFLLQRHGRSRPGLRSLRRPTPFGGRSEKRRARPATLTRAEVLLKFGNQPAADAPVPPSDHDLVRAALGGSERAFRILVERYQRAVLSLVARILANREDAEDVAQEAFVKAFTRLDTFDPAFKFSNWLFKIAHNTALDALRKRAATPGVSHEGLNEGGAGLGVELPDPRAESPDEAAAMAEFRRDVERALAGLRPEYRSVILLRHLEGRAYEDIAEILELPLGTVKTFLFRARRELAGLLEQHRQA